MRQKIQVLFQKKNIKQTLLDTTFILFLFSLLYQLTLQFFQKYGFESWQLSEFLINYEDGFVRRGLMGQILFLLTKNYHIDVEWAVKIISLISFILVCIFFIKAFLKKGYPLYILPLCFFLGMGILSDNWIRKDYLMLCFFISILLLYKGSLNTLIKMVLINILIILILFTHEIFAFLAFPIFLVLFFNEYKTKGILQSIILSLVFLSPSIFAFLLTIQYHGNTETAQNIWDSWQIITNNPLSTVTHEGSPAVNSIGWTGKEALKLHFGLNFLATDRSVSSLFVWLVTFPVIYYIATNVLMVFTKTKNSFRIEDKTLLSFLLLFQLFWLIPVFLFLSCDYIRLFFYWVSTSFAIFLIIPTETIAKLIPSFLAVKINALNSFSSNILAPKKTTLVFLMLFLGISFYSLHIEEVITSSVLYNVLLIISKPFTIFKDILVYFK